MSAQDKLDLVREVYNKFYDATESFEANNVGSHLSYLLGSIANDDEFIIDNDENQFEFFKLLRTLFGPSHPVFKYITVIEEE